MENNTIVKKLPETDWRDLILEVLSHWRGIILVALIGILIFGAIGFVISQKEKEATQAESVNELSEKYTIESLEKSLSPEEKMNVEDAILNEDLLLKNEEFIAISPLFQIDSTKACMTDVVIKYMESEEKKGVTENKGYGVATEYKGVLDTMAMREYIADQCGIEGDTSALIVLQDCSGAVISFRFYNTSEEQCEKMADAFIEYLDTKKKDMQKTLRPHWYEIIDRSFSTGNAPDLAKAQQKTYEDSSNYGKRMTNYFKNFTLEEIYYYKLLLMDKYGDEKIVEDSGIEFYEVKEKQKEEAEKNGENQADVAAREKKTDSPVKRAVKMGLLGMILFVIVYIIIVGYRYALSTKLNDVDELSEIYQIKSFGKIYHGSKRKFPLDRLINKARRCGREAVDKKEAEEIIISNAVNEINAQGAKKIALIGKTENEELTGILEERLKGISVEFTELKNPSANAEELKNLENIDAAIIFAKTKETCYGEIWDEIEILKNRNITILGGAVL